MNNIVKTIVESMKRYPDKWNLVKHNGTNKLAWARLNQNGDVVDVSLNGTLELGKTMDKTKKLAYGDIPLGWRERSKLKTAVQNLLREKAMRQIERVELEEPENSETS